MLSSSVFLYFPTGHYLDVFQISCDSVYCIVVWTHSSLITIKNLAIVVSIGSRYPDWTIYSVHIPLYC